MKAMLNTRLTMLSVLLIAIGIFLLTWIAIFPFRYSAASALIESANSSYRQLRNLIPDRGRIFDRNGEVLATNIMDYRISASPNVILDKAKAAHLLAAALNDDEARIAKLIADDNSQYVVLASEVSTETAQKVAETNLFGVKTEPIPVRRYPQGSLASQVVGFVGWRDDTRRGYVGVEGAYNTQLTGQVRVQPYSAIPFEVNPNDQPPPGNDVYLTIDRNIQYLAETELQSAIKKYGAVTGSVLIMDPRNGEILAMASYPNFDPNSYYKTLDPNALKNPIVSDTYEPGSVFKIVTGSVALQSGKLGSSPLNWTYLDRSPFVVGGLPIYNWDRAGHGSQSFVDIFVKSLNIGTSHLAIDVLGADAFYKGLKSFGVGSRTGIDLEGEEGGILYQPGDRFWSDSELATNSFGQGLTVTPLQMLSFANTIANNGQMMQPHVRYKIVDGKQVIMGNPSVIRTPISPDVAHTFRDIMIKVVNDPVNGEGSKAKIPGYTVAGKTGTAQFVCDTCAGAYDPDLYEATFVGFLPADEPRVSILIKLDKVSDFASQNAAPAFAELVKRLVVLMNIPSDAQRQALQAQGGNTALIAGE